MPCHIVVCVKAAMITAPKGRTVRTSETCYLNPFDRPALHAALTLRERLGGTITALSMGPRTCAFVLFEALAMGIDRGILLSDPAFAGSDTLATSTVLAAALRRLAPFDLLLFGARTSDSDTGQVGPQIAVALDLPLVTGAVSFEPEVAGLVVDRRMDGLREAFAVDFPAALTIHPSAVRPEDMTLTGIAGAYESQSVEEWGLRDLGLTPGRVGEAGSATRVVSLTRAARERRCEFLTGQTGEQAEALVQRLLELGLIG